MLNHIGISVINKEEIEIFYKYILGFNEDYNFTIDSNTTEEIFGIAKEIDACKLSRNGLTLEIFIAGKKASEEKYTHFCLNMKDRTTIIKKLEEKKYSFKIIERPNKTLIFAYDKSGNIFEIMEEE